MIEKSKRASKQSTISSQGIRRVPLRSAIEGDKVIGIKRPSPRNHPSHKELEARVHEETKNIEYELDQERSTGRFFKWFLSIVVVVGIFIGLTHVFARAEVSITPKQETFPVSLAVTAYGQASNGQLRFETLTKIFEKEVMIPATDTEYVETKASGKIRIFNNYSANAQTFVEETRFMASDGKIYKTGKGVRVTVPGKKGSTPGFVDTMVYAAEPGVSYNKELDDFTIPGFQGSPKYTGFTARSLTPMSGGFQGTSAVVAQTSIDTSLDSLKKSLQEEVLLSVRQQTPESFVTLPGGMIAGNLTHVIDRTVKDGVMVRVSQPVTFVLFDRVNMTSYLAHAFIPGYTSDSDRLMIHDVSTIRVTVPETISENTSEVKLVLDGSVSFSWLTSADSIRSKIAGMKKQSIPEIITSFETIEHGDVVLRPAWLMNVPKKHGRISVNSVGTYE